MLRRHITLAALVALVIAMLASFTPTAHAVDKDCGDFDTQAQAQNFFDDAGPGDPHLLDADNDGIACESLPCPCSTGSGGGGDDGGGGGNDDTIKQKARVLRVIDGDTVKVKLMPGRRRSVRLIGIDTPELHQDCGAGGARRALKHRLPRGTRVRLVSDPTQAKTDRYDRLLRYVHRVRGGKDQGLLQLRRGWARVYVYDNDPFKRVRSYRKGQRAARDHDRGMWGTC